MSTTEATLYGLSRAEEAIYDALIRANGRVVGCGQLASAVRGTRALSHDEASAVRTHIFNLRAKLPEEQRSALRAKRGKGYYIAVKAADERAELYELRRIVERHHSLYRHCSVPPALCPECKGVL